MCERKMSLRKEFIVESEVNRTLRMAGRHEEEKPLTLITRELRRQLLNVTLCWMDAPAAPPAAAVAAVPPAHHWMGCQAAQPTVTAKNSIVLARKTAFWQQQCVCLDLIFQMHHLQQPMLSRPPQLCTHSVSHWKLSNLCSTNRGHPQILNWRNFNYHTI